MTGEGTESQEESGPNFFEKIYTTYARTREGIGKAYNNEYFWPVILVGALGASIAVTSCYNSKKIENLSKQVAIGDSTLVSKIEEEIEISRQNGDTLCKIGNNIYALSDTANKTLKNVYAVNHTANRLEDGIEAFSGNMKHQHAYQDQQIDDTGKKVREGFDEAKEEFSGIRETLSEIKERQNSLADTNAMRDLHKKLGKKANKGLFGWGFLNLL